MNITVPVYSEQALSPRAAEVLRAIVDATYPEHTVKFRPYTMNDRKVLVFGSITQVPLTGREFIRTYSIAQIMSKANAASVIGAALRRFITEPEPVPFTVISESVAPQGILEDWDFDAPTAIDIETNGNLGKTHTPEDVEIISVALYQQGHEPVVFMERYTNIWADHSLPLNPRQVTVLADLLPKFTKAIYHNGKFDTRVLNRVLGIKLKVWFDTMLAHHVLNHAAGAHGLKHLAMQYLSAPEWEKDLSKYTKGGGHYEFIPGALLRDYNGYDVYWTWKLWEFLAPQIEADENEQGAFEFEMEAADFLLDVEGYGIPFNSEYADEFGLELDDRMVSAKVRLVQLTESAAFNPASPQQVKRWLGNKGYPVGSTNEEGLNEVKASASAQGDGNVVTFCETLLAYRKAAKIKGTYVGGWSSKVRGGRVHPTYLVHGTSTGRLSSTQPNAQNVPRDKVIRKLVSTHGIGI